MIYICMTYPHSKNKTLFPLEISKVPQLLSDYLFEYTLYVNMNLIKPIKIL